MIDSPSLIAAAMRAMHGESEIDAVSAALSNRALAHVLATLPNVHLPVHVIAALSSQLTALLDPRAVSEPSARNAIRSLAETPKGSWIVFDSLAKVAPVGWGSDIEDVLVTAVQHETCHPAAASVLIGPHATTVAQIDNPDAAAFVIRRWGQDNPKNPTWWTAHIPKQEQKRLHTLLTCDSRAFASCFPWLPSTMIKRRRIAQYAVDAALDAFANASPHVRALHADLISRITAQAQLPHLESLTRLACATSDTTIWDCVTALVRKEPDAAVSVVIAASWNDLSHDVQSVIMDSAAWSPVCAVIAAAQGKRLLPDITPDIADVFFSALDSNVWNAFDPQTQRQLLHTLAEYHFHFAIRSLGPRPEILAKARCYNNLVDSIRWHEPDHTKIRWLLLPVALRDVPPSVAHALIGALPTMPPDPSVFFCVSSGRDDIRAAHLACTTLRTPDDLAVAVVIQRCVDPDNRTPNKESDLVEALRGRTWNDLLPIRDLLDTHAQTIVTPDADALAQRLSEPEHREKMVKAINRLASLPPDIAIPSLLILEQWSVKTISGWDAATVLLERLHDHGDVYLDVYEALPHERARYVLPSPTEPRLADAVRALARDHVACAYDLSLALSIESWNEAIQALLTAPPKHANAIWNALPSTMRHTLERCIAATMTSDEERNAMVNAMGAAIARTNDPITALAFAAVRSHDESLRSAGIAALRARQSLLRLIWLQDEPDLRSIIRSTPTLHVSIADLSDERPQATHASQSQRWRIRP